MKNICFLLMNMTISKNVILKVAYFYKIYHYKTLGPNND
jgi:hypothetical protein